MKSSGPNEPIGICPLCQARILETAISYACQHSVGENVRCKVKIGKKILEQPIDREQATKLLSQGKTELLRGFVSNRTKKKFSAFLTMAVGKVSFEFEKGTKIGTEGKLQGQ